MKNYIYFFMISMIFYCLTFSQIIAGEKNKYKVLAANGEVYFKVESQKNWKRLFISNEFGPKDSIKIGEDSYLGITYENGTLEIRTPGNYLVKDIFKAKKNKKSGFFSKLYHFINEIANNIFKQNKEDYHDNMKFSATVERIPEYGITLSLPSKFNVISDCMSFCWNDIEYEEPSYKIVITDINNNTIMNVITQDTNSTINLLNSGIKKGEVYILNVSYKLNPIIKSFDHKFLILNEEDSIAILKEWQLLENELDLNTAIDNIIIALFLQEKELFFQADIYFRKAFELAPNIKDYKEIYFRFLNN